MRDAAIYTQQLDGENLAILWGGLQTANPSSWMNMMADKYYGNNPHNLFVEQCFSTPVFGAMFITPIVIMTGLNNLPFSSYFKKKLPLTKVYKHNLALDGKKGEKIGEVVIIFDQNIGLKEELVNQHLDEVQKSIVKGRKYNIFIDQYKDNPYIRIIIFGIEKLPFVKFVGQRIPSDCDLGESSQEINDEMIGKMAYITRDWLSYMTSITKAKKQVNEDTLRYVLCDFWERRISENFATEEKYHRFPTREMDIKWRDKKINYCVEIKYVSEETDTKHELQRIFNDLFRLSLEKAYLKQKKPQMRIRCLFIIFGPSSLFEKHLRSHVTIYTGLHPNYTFGVKDHRNHILKECLSFYKDEPHREIILNDITRPYYDGFKTEYDNNISPQKITTDLLELVLADNVFDTKQQSVAVWEIDREK